MRHLLMLVPAAALVLASCEKEAAPTTVPEATPAADSGDAPAEESGEETAAAEPEEKSWKDMDRKERMTHMGTVVFPRTKKEFKDFNGEQFAEFKCQTCHGEDMKEVDYKLPNDLTPLSASDPWQSAVDMDEDMANFMAQVVMPSMSEMLDMEVKEDGSGELSCFTCHLKDE